MFIIIKLSEIYDLADPMRDFGQGFSSFPSEHCKSQELEAEIEANERGERNSEDEIKERLRLQIIYSRYNFRPQSFSSTKKVIYDIKEIIFYFLGREFPFKKWKLINRPRMCDECE